MLGLMKTITSSPGSNFSGYTELFLGGGGGGGAGGGNQQAGGGGGSGGGYIDSSTQWKSITAIAPNTTYTITLGTGGAGGAAGNATARGQNGANGSPTIAFGITAPGGWGGNVGYDGIYYNPGDGGSLGTLNSGVPSHGGQNGAITSGNTRKFGGAGGDVGTGTMDNATTTAAASTSGGLNYSLLGDYGLNGGAGGGNATVAGGQVFATTNYGNGGGSGSPGGVNGMAGKPGTGSGGGGGSGAGGAGGAGSNGFAYVRISRTEYTGNITGNVTVTYDATSAILKFLSDGTYTSGN